MSLSVRPSATSTPFPIGVYWTAFIGLFFDYYDFYLFIYLDKTLTREFGLSRGEATFGQTIGFVGVGVGALLFGYLADRFGRGRVLAAVFIVYVLSLTGLSLSGSFPVLILFRFFAAASLGAEWGISQSYIADAAPVGRRYLWGSFLQFAILGGLLAALVSQFLLPVVGWRWLFAGSVAPVALLSAIRWHNLVRFSDAKGRDQGKLAHAIHMQFPRFIFAFSFAALTIATGTINVFLAKELPQSVWATVFFWFNVAPGMLLGAWLVGRVGIKNAIFIYATGLTTLSCFAFFSTSPNRALAFALTLPLLNGIPFGLMGAWFNELFSGYRTMLSGAAYNLGRILGGFAPVLILTLRLNENGRYFIFTIAAGIGVLVLAIVAPLNKREDISEVAAR